MKIRQSLRFVFLIFTLILLELLIFPFQPSQWKFLPRLIDDRKVTVVTPADVAMKREELIRYIWGNGGFPTRKLPSKVQTDVESPIPNLPDLERVDLLTINMEAMIRGRAFYFIPIHKNYRLVIVHQGHACTLHDGPGSGNQDVGVERLINRLLLDGFSVLGVYMPHQNPEDCWDRNHDAMFDAYYGAGSPMKYFLEPVAASLNYLNNENQFKDISMIGISGGGWTTTVYAALDPTIRFSFPVAGSMPLYLRGANYNHDTEQYLSSFYKIAGYPDLYVLGSYGTGRHQVQILNRQDDCCFGEDQHDSVRAAMPWDEAVHGYEGNVQGTLKILGAGSFFLYVDDTATSHTITENTIVNVILPILQQEEVPVSPDD